MQNNKEKKEWWDTRAFYSFPITGPDFTLLVFDNKPEGKAEWDHYVVDDKTDSEGSGVWQEHLSCLPARIHHK